MKNKNFEKKSFQKAANIIEKGEIVAFPTETVYGLGANVFDIKAVKKIFETKGRPSDNPLIVHISNISELEQLVDNIPKEAEILMKKFWPGSLTLIFFKSKLVPKIVSAGGNTVGVRMPDNKIAKEFIKKCGVPIAAPSANISGRPSPTSAEHVFTDFGDKVFILDGGSCKVGLESTVLDLTVKPFQVLRPGGISFEELKKVLKNIELHPALFNKKLPNKLKSPGMKYKHYSPEAKIILFSEKKMIENIQKIIIKYKKENKKVGVISTKETKNNYDLADLVLDIGSKNDLEKTARNLFKIFREFDEHKVDIILSETFSDKGIGFATMNRLRKAADNIF